MQVPAWRSLTLLAAALVGSYVITWPYLSESPRWLLAVGRRVRGFALKLSWPTPSTSTLPALAACTAVTGWVRRAARTPVTTSACTAAVPVSDWGHPACLQGEATAVLAAIASTNRTHLPEVPLQEPIVGSSTLQQSLRELLGHSRLRKRLLIMLVVWCCCSQVRACSIAAD